MYCEQLRDRAILSITGSDKITFLQGLLTNDIQKLTYHPIYSLILTPQGKFLYDFYLVLNDDEILLDCDVEKYDQICKKFAIYKLRSDISINPVKDQYKIFSIYGKGSANANNSLVFIDPRYSLLGSRAILKAEYAEEFLKKHHLVPAQNYTKLIYDLSTPLPHIDLISEESFPLEFGMDFLNAISFEKGCYVGQELTARTKHRGVVRKKIYKIIAQSDLSEVKYGAEIMVNQNKIGKFCSAFNNIGKALIREEDYLACNSQPILLNGIEINLQLSLWYS